MNATMYQPKSAGNTAVQPGKGACKKQWPALLYSAAATLCDIALFMLRSAFELTYLFLCAVVLTLPLLIVLEISFGLRKEIKMVFHSKTV